MSIEPRAEIAEILAGGFLRLKKDDITAPKILPALKRGSEKPSHRIDTIAIPHTAARLTTSQIAEAAFSGRGISQPNRIANQGGAKNSVGP